jgi:hypothetical protein
MLSASVDSSRRDSSPQAWAIGFAPAAAVRQSPAAGDGSPPLSCNAAAYPQRVALAR